MEELREKVKNCYNFPKKVGIVFVERRKSYKDSVTTPGKSQSEYSKFNPNRGRHTSSFSLDFNQDASHFSCFK